jgi:hypothetical protein
MNHIDGQQGGGFIKREALARLALDLILHERVGGGAHEDGVGRCTLLEPGRPMESGAHRVGLLRRIRPRTYHHGPAVQPQAQHHTGRLATKRGGSVHTLTQLAGCQHGSAGMVLLRHRGPKQRQEALAGDVEQGTVIALHRLLGQRQHVVHQAVHRLRSEPCSQGRRFG